MKKYFSIVFFFYALVTVGQSQTNDFHVRFEVASDTQGIFQPLKIRLILQNNGSKPKEILPIGGYNNRLQSGELFAIIKFPFINYSISQLYQSENYEMGTFFDGPQYITLDSGAVISTEWMQMPLYDSKRTNIVNILPLQAEIHIELTLIVKHIGRLTVTSEKKNIYLHNHEHEPRNAAASQVVKNMNDPFIFAKMQIYGHAMPSLSDSTWIKQIKNYVNADYAVWAALIDASNELSKISKSIPNEEKKIIINKAMDNLVFAKQCNKPNTQKSINSVGGVIWYHLREMFGNDQELMEEDAFFNQIKARLISTISTN